MIRSNMYMLPQQQPQQQQMPQRPTMYRQQGPMAGMDSLQNNSTEWRHLLMTQQQSTNFNTMRPNFQQGGYTKAYFYIFVSKQIYNFTISLEVDLELNVSSAE